MKILIACEESGIVREAFAKKGHEVTSCDILPSSIPASAWNNSHYQGDVRGILWTFPWDMIIAFPPCTDLAVSGARHFARKRIDGSQQKSIDFFMLFANHKCNKIAIENPVSIMSSVWRKPDQIIQPFHFGHEAKKTTCLWLKGLPLLKPTKIVGEGEIVIMGDGKKYPKWSHDPIGTNGKKLAYNSKEIKVLRSKTFQGIADAMAEQWGFEDLLLSNK